MTSIKQIKEIAKERKWDFSELSAEIKKQGYEPFAELIELARSSDEKVRLSANKLIIDKLIASKKYIETNLAPDAKENLEKLRSEMEALIKYKTKDY